MSLQEAKQFVAHFVNGDYTPEEYATFLQWLRGATVEELNIIADEHEALHESWSVSSSAPSPEWVAMLEGKLDELVVGVDETPVRHIESRPIVGRRAWMAAASVLVLITAGTVWYTQRPHGDNGSVANGQEKSAPKLSQVMENPAGGGQKQLVLADGSIVWLNSASTLKYPTVFTGPERVVELSGEAFFEVTKSAGKPFRVLIKDAEVEVLGTHFNIMAYDDEPISKTTLIDGAVRVESGEKQIELKPGQQVQLTYPTTANGEVGMTVRQVDLDAALGWRSGDIEVADADLHTVMRVLKRYYNVEIQYAQDLPATLPLTAGFSLQDGLRKNLKRLEGFYGLHFTNDGKIVTVTR